MDPITLLTAATASYEAIKAAVGYGQEAIGLVKEISELMASVTELTRLSAEPVPSGWRDKRSAEQIALDAYTSRKQAEELQYKVRGMVVSTYGLKAWDEILHTIAEVKREQKLESLRRAEKKQRLIENIVTSIVIMFVATVLIGFAGLVFLYVTK
jgi:hypothetical protein